MAWKHKFDEQWKGIKPRSLRWFLCSMNMTLNVAAQSRGLSHSQILCQCYPANSPGVALLGLGLCAWIPQPRLMWRCLQREERAPFSLHSISVTQAWAPIWKGLDGSGWEGLGGWGEFSVGGGSTWQPILPVTTGGKNLSLIFGGIVANSEPSLPKLKEGCHLMITSSNFCFITTWSWLRGTKLIPSRAACFNLRFSSSATVDLDLKVVDGVRTWLLTGHRRIKVLPVRC